MYPVSDAFLQAVQENTRTYYWTGRITTIAGIVYEFGYTDIVKGSGYISRQCCGSTEIELGTVYSAELGITLFTRLTVIRWKMQKWSCPTTCFCRMASMRKCRWDSLRFLKRTGP